MSKAPSGILASKLISARTWAPAGARGGGRRTFSKTMSRHRAVSPMPRNPFADLLRNFLPFVVVPLSQADAIKFLVIDIGLNPNIYDFKDCRAADLAGDDATRVR